jgi:hypothetical protein
VPVTLADLRAAARDRADMQGAFVADKDLDVVLNAGWYQLYKLLVSINEDFFITSTTIAMVAGQDTYDLSGVAPKIYKVRGVDIVVDPSLAVPLRKFEWAERGRFTGFPDLNIRRYGSVLKYLFQGQSVKILPLPQGGQNLKIWYIPRADKLVATVPAAGETNSLPSVIEPGWEEYIVLVAAIKMLAKEEGDVSVHADSLRTLREEILGDAPNRDAEAPMRMIRRSNDDDPYGWTP